MTLHLTRRAALGSLAAAAATPVLAKAPMLGPLRPMVNRVKLGAFEVTTILDGTWAREGLHPLFGANATADEVAALAASNGLPTGEAEFTFVPIVVNTGSELVLFDTGLNAEATGAALEAAGYSTDQIDVVVITHMHGDHIGGMTKDDGSATYANARYVTGRAEYDAWASQDNDRFKTKVEPFAEKMTFLEDGGSVASGLTAMAAFGHTPGHMNYMIEDGGTQMYLGADFANHYVLSLAQPDWEVKFDMDKPAAAATRKRILDMLATDKIAFTGYHMPWPGVGYVDKKDGTYSYVPHSYQLML